MRVRDKIVGLVGFRVDFRAMLSSVLDIMNTSPQARRQTVLEQMARITHMERGRLSAEYRPGSGGSKERGPYYKHQVWEKGRNVSRRVVAEQAAALQEAIEGYERFEQLADDYVEATVAMTRAERDPDSKKNGRRSPNRAVRRPKRS